MPRRAIYVICDGQRDLSRWMSVVPSSNGDCIVKLQDMTHPGMPSGLKEFRAPYNVLCDVLRDGFVQVTVRDGFCQLLARDDLIEVTFRGPLDERTHRSEVSREEFAALIAEACQPVGATA